MRLVMKCGEVHPTSQRFRVKLIAFIGNKTFPWVIGHTVTYDEIQSIFIPAHQAMAEKMGWQFEIDYGNSHTHRERQGEIRAATR